MLGPGQGWLWRSYRYNPLGELAEQNDSVRGRIDYRYDPAGRLLRQDRGTGIVQEQFAWDAAGNLLAGDNQRTRSQGLVEGNRLKVWQDIRYDYDPWGNVSHKRKGTRLSQHLNRHRKATMANTALAENTATADPQSLGQLLGTYGKSRSFLFVGWFLAALFAGLGGFMLWLTTRIGSGFQYNGAVRSLHAVGFGGLMVGATIAFVFWRLAASQPTFRLYENGVRASIGGNDSVILYRDLEDVFTFYYGGIAYRASPGAPWYFIAGRIHKYAQLRRRLRSLQVEHRGALLEQKLDAGLPVVFRCFDDRVGKAKSMVASRNVNFPTFDLILTRDRLQIDQKNIALNRIRDINTNLWSEKSTIVDVDGNVFFKIHPSSILSFDLLHYLIERQQSTA